MKNLFIGLLTLTSLSAFATPVTDSIKTIKSVLTQEKTAGVDSADCEVLFTNTDASAQVSIIQKSTNQSLVDFVLFEQSGSTVYSMTQMGRKITIKIQQDSTGKQMFKFDGKKKTLTLKTDSSEASCILK